MEGRSPFPWSHELGKGFSSCIVENFSVGLRRSLIAWEGFRILWSQATAVPNTIAAILLYLRDFTGKEPHVYSGWAEGNPLQFLARFILLGEGDVAIMTREVLRKAEPDPDRRPAIPIGG
jgi:hypothetical protein